MLRYFNIQGTSAADVQANFWNQNATTSAVPNTPTLTQELVTLRTEITRLENRVYQLEEEAKMKDRHIEHLQKLKHGDVRKVLRRTRVIE